MDNNTTVISKSSFWTNLFKSPTENSELEEVLISMPPFQTFNSKFIKLLTKIVHNRLYAANEYIFFQNDPGIALYIIIKGEVLITQDENGDRFDLALLSRGDFFGELALIDGARRSASALALKESQLAVIFRPDLDEFVESHPKEGVNILKGFSTIVATRLRNLNQDYFALYHKTKNK
ncbi:MAG: cyclic nucleotide-binding domain-containing protein [Ignavibacteriae bacterium HGW-Ignavibacteriae-3]|nr:MAG: cyclic nucleotide-binding domain-containing protein [Ignavibacteriae bacterium HGW-Ignavibacteriae-3]